MSGEQIGTLPLFVVDAFSDHAFGGNPAGVVILDQWLPEETLQQIAAQVNLSETAFLVDRHLRWFTPGREVDLCGHATLATAHVIVHHRACTEICLWFETRSGVVQVDVGSNGFIMNFPARAATNGEVPRAAIEMAIGARVGEILVSHDRYVCFMDDAFSVAAVQPDMLALAHLALPGVIVTAADSGGADFVSRYFAPAKGVPEDPVTGTSHCVLAPLWGAKLGKSALIGRQLSRRGGQIRCEVKGDRVLLEGSARTFSIGHMML